MSHLLNLLLQVSILCVSPIQSVALGNFSQVRLYMFRLSNHDDVLLSRENVTSYWNSKFPSFYVCLFKKILLITFHSLDVQIGTNHDLSISFFTTSRTLSSLSILTILFPSISPSLSSYFFHFQTFFLSLSLTFSFFLSLSLSLNLGLRQVCVVEQEVA